MALFPIAARCGVAILFAAPAAAASIAGAPPVRNAVDDLTRGVLSSSAGRSDDAVCLQAFDTAALPCDAAFRTDGDVPAFAADMTSPYQDALLEQVGAVPEPVSWATMLGGFGLLGGALRARRRPGRRPISRPHPHNGRAPARAP